MPSRIKYNAIRNTALPVDERERHLFSLPMHPYRHMGMEAMSVFTTALNESLLQSHDGLIRLAPAVTETHRARFTLHAEGCFIVSAEIDQGLPTWIFIESTRGACCRVASPWSHTVVYEGEQLLFTRCDAVIEFMTQAGGRYLLVPDDSVKEHWQTTPVQYARNDQPKAHASGFVRLGWPALY